MVQGARVLSEGLARTAAVARCAADEAIASVATALELCCSLVTLDRTHVQEKTKAATAQSSSSPTPAAASGKDIPLDLVTSRPDRPLGHNDTSGDEDSDLGSKQASPRPKSEVSSPEDTKLPENMRSRQASLRVRNLLCLECLNEEVLALQKSLRTRLQQREKQLLPAVEPADKDGVFELVTQMLQSAVAEASHLVTGTAMPSQQVLEQAFPFLLALEHADEVAVPADVKTQTLKLAALLDVSLLCRIVEGPFRQRLLAVPPRRPRGSAAPGGRRSAGLPRAPEARAPEARRPSEGGEGWAEAVQRLCTRVVLGLRRSCGAGEA